MAYEAIRDNVELLKKEDKNGDAIVNAISLIEDFPYFKSVGYGGLPNEKCIVELDSAFMNGNTLQIGAIAGVRNIKNPVKVARRLSLEKFNCMLVGTGAEEFAISNKFEMANMLSDRAEQHYKNKIKLLNDNPELSPYDGHDTVGMISLDNSGNMFAATSTSGLFMKKTGRVGDSPISGSGFYCDAEVGGATATGLGEDIMKGCLSYEVVRKMKEGTNVADAAKEVVFEFDQKLKKCFGKCGPISIVALDKDGNYGIGTNCEFSFAAGNQNEEVNIYVATPNLDTKEINIEVASEE
ncbi:hypothetical protein Zmor_016291 [Zophobas morio]|uniref:N(4)-(Beta-N-acetylglucosaminyl)-L-asparaginase n=1 Tax=Zophobas morio TaxID=2755281 RepID=A0AA38HIK6_9CUCU|nr:hypothetical protein Zmor_016291 [Zophobas morio]